MLGRCGAGEALELAAPEIIPVKSANLRGFSIQLHIEGNAQ
jgi:hypothetical protein